MSVYSRVGTNKQFYVLSIPRVSWPSSFTLYLGNKASAKLVRPLYIQNLLRITCMQNKTLFILGDFSDNLLAYDDKIANITKKNKVKQIIYKPTTLTPTSMTVRSCHHQLTWPPTIPYNTGYLVTLSFIKHHYQCHKSHYYFFSE